MGPLASMVRAYEKHRQWTLELPHLGYPGASRGVFKGVIFPPQPIGELNLRTKDPNVLCMEFEGAGKKQLQPLAGPMSWTAMRNMTKYLVAMGGHPLDIIIATWDKDTGEFAFRTAVDHLLWTFEDQGRLSRDAAA